MKSSEKFIQFVQIEHLKNVSWDKKQSRSWNRDWKSGLASGISCEDSTFFYSIRSMILFSPLPYRVLCFVWLIVHPSWTFLIPNADYHEVICERLIEIINITIACTEVNSPPSWWSTVLVVVALTFYHSRHLSRFQYLPYHNGMYSFVFLDCLYTG